MNLFSGSAGSKSMVAKRVVEPTCTLTHAELKDVGMVIRTGDIACIVRNGLFSKEPIDRVMESRCVQQLRERVTGVDADKFNTAIKAILEQTRKSASSITAMTGLKREDVNELIANNCSAFR